MTTHTHTHSSSCNHNNNNGVPAMSTGTPHLTVAQMKGMSVSDFYKTRIGMTITTCMVCDRPLHDSQSVTEGIGPDCSRKYGYHRFVPTTAQIQAAFGHLALLPIATDKAVMNFLVANQTDQRKFANILVAYCGVLSSSNRKSEVFKYTDTFRALGLNVLARQLEISQCQIRVLAHAVDGVLTGKFVVRFPSCYGTAHNPIKEVKRYLGSWLATTNYKGMGLGKKFLCTQTELNLLLWCLAPKFHGELVFNTGTVLPLPQQSALPLPPEVVAYRAARTPAVATAPTPRDIGLTVIRKSGRNGSFFTVALPPYWNMGFWKPNKSDQRAFWDAFKNDFKSSARAFWNGTYKNWVVKGSNEQAMIDSITRHLGYTRQQLGL